jgi:hypothetical protein
MGMEVVGQVAAITTEDVVMTVTVATVAATNAVMTVTLADTVTTITVLVAAARISWHNRPSRSSLGRC